MKALAILAVLVGIAAPGKPRPNYATERGCSHWHRSHTAYERVRLLMRNHRPVVRRRAVAHYATCVATREKSRALWGYVRRSWRWRHSYAHAWPIRLNREPASWRAWAWNTSWCESRRGADPRTNTNGYRGRFQWVLSTWRSAGGVGDPAVASYAHEAVIAIGLARREGTHHWPRCG